MKNLKTPAIIIASSLFLWACAGNSDTTLETPTPQQVMEAKQDLWVVPTEQTLEPQEVVMNDEKMMMSKTIEINAKKWEFDKPIIRVKQWEKITLKINNTDVLHWITIPAMKVVEDNEITLDTSKKWEFEYVCANYCGDKHRSMKWKIIIE